MLRLLFLLATLRIIASLDCSVVSSCSQCLQFSTCAWCSSTSKCLSLDISRLVCPQMLHTTYCPAAFQNDMEKQKLDKVFQLLSSLKSYKSAEQQKVAELPAQQNTPQQNNYANIVSSILREDKGDEDSTSTEMKQLLHKLMLLRMLKRLKESGGSLSAEDRKLLEDLTKTEEVVTTPTPTSVTDELSKLLKLLREKEKQNSLKNVLENVATSAPNTTLSVATTPRTTITNTATSVNASVSPRMTAANHEEKVSIETEEEEEKVSTPATPTTVVAKSYCGLMSELEMCNNDRNCTWCNTMETCIANNNKDYNVCVASKEKVLDNKFGVDRCLANLDCKGCVRVPACYWCEKSESCHAYPFFGYVPTSCGGDWYVKQCDVQLAVIVIVLPLMIILLAMITFYFCLKYCYYRRRILRVPLFEKPGIFDYRKDKKVYFVNPDEEDDNSEDEFSTEKLRRKFRLPQEKAPLIDPNS